ncbi:hypothetical protein C2G38_178728 [Gigaspora rosea]|uniref:Uncharacterized protein n=1 Tax=Gigaspora rosea TaxID=44941 RepID=A0A397UTP8_9GLOM|nr:hypothetical protein C2G38_178728 [Gigaspora rosea]
MVLIFIHHLIIAPYYLQSVLHPLLSASLNVTALASTSSRTPTNSFLVESSNILIALSKRLPIFCKNSYLSRGLKNLTFGHASSNPSSSSISLYNAEKFLSIFLSMLLKAVRKTSTGTDFTFSFPLKCASNSSLIPLSASWDSSSKSSSKSPPPSASKSTSTASPVLSLGNPAPGSRPLLFSFDCASGPLSFLLSK